MSTEPAEPMPLTRRTYLLARVMAETGCDWMTALEAVSSTAIEHPEWDMDERRTYEEWEKRA